MKRELKPKPLQSDDGNQKLSGADAMIEALRIHALEAFEEKAKREMKTKPNISKRAFWDTDFEKLDYEKHAKDIIFRICEHGTDDDFYEITKHYGKDMVNAVIDNRMDEIFNLPRVNQFAWQEVTDLKRRRKQLENR